MASLPLEGGPGAHRRLVRLGSHHLDEGDVLRRLDRLGDQQQGAAVARQEITAVEVDLQRAAALERHLEQQRADLERILLEQLFDKEGGRAGQLAEVFTHLRPDRVVGEARGEPDVSISRRLDVLVLP